MILITGYHDFCCGHRVMLGEGPCTRLHGHNYRVTWNVRAPIDQTGHAIEFAEIKRRLNAWLEAHWDHRFLLYVDDPMGMLFRNAIADPGPAPCTPSTLNQLEDSLVYVPFHPTTEAIALYLLKVVGPQQLQGTGAILQSVHVQETRKYGASASLPLPYDEYEHSDDPEPQPKKD